jgi:hypothetical protein
MSDSDDMDARVAALGATVHEEGASVAAPAHEYPLDMLSSSSEEEEAPTLPVKKRKSKGGRLTARRKKTTRRVSGEQETPSPNTANNLLENRVNDLENEVETVEGKLVSSEESNKLANKSVTLLKQEIKLLKDQLKLASGEDAAQEICRLKGEVLTLSNASVKATRLGEELAAEKTTVNLRGAEAVEAAASTQNSDLTVEHPYD